jgi:hypothetical protein
MGYSPNTVMRTGNAPQFLPESKHRQYPVSVVLALFTVKVYTLPLVPHVVGDVHFRSVGHFETIHLPAFVTVAWFSVKKSQHNNLRNLQQKPCELKEEEVVFRSGFKVYLKKTFALRHSPLHSFA